MKALALPRKPHPDTLNVIIGCTGSVASIKIPLLCSQLLDIYLPPATTTRSDRRAQFNITLLPSRTSLSFFSLADVPDPVHIVHDEDEWATWTGRGDPILHIELRKWCDVLLVAPLSAYTLAKIHGGLCDTVLLETIRAWDYSPLHSSIDTLATQLAVNGHTPLPAPTPPASSSTSVPSASQDSTSIEPTQQQQQQQQQRQQPELERRKVLACAPAMNTHMYTNPLTALHLATLRDTLGFTLLGPIEKTLMCGDSGVGGMLEVRDLVAWLRSLTVTHSKSLDPSRSRDLETTTGKDDESKQSTRLLMTERATRRQINEQLDEEEEEEEDDEDKDEEEAGGGEDGSEVVKEGDESDATFESCDGAADVEDNRDISAIETMQRQEDERELERWQSETAARLNAQNRMAATKDGGT